MTKTADPDRTQDWLRLATYLRAQGHSFDADAGVRALSGGSANFNFLISLDGCPAVLRQPPAASQPAADAIAREFRVLSGLGKVYGYAPRAIHHCADPTIIGAPFCISEFRSGEAVTKTVPASLAGRPHIGRHLGEITIDALALLHAVDPAAAGLADLGRPDGFLRRQVDGWYQRGLRSFIPADAEKAAAVRQWLLENLPPSPPAAIVHNDFKLDNMLIDPDNLQVNAVLDWDMCTLGDPLYDFAILLLYWGQADDDALHRNMAEMPYTADGWMTRREAVERYCRASGRDLPLPRLKFYWILTELRLAGVMAQLLALYDKGALRSVRVNERTADAVRAHISCILNNAYLLLDRELSW